MSFTVLIKTNNLSIIIVVFYSIISSKPILSKSTPCNQNQIRKFFKELEKSIKYKFSK